MEIPGETWLLAALLAAVACLDRRAMFQTLIGQPMITGLIAGVLFGQAQAGLTAGALIQFAWISGRKGTSPPDATTAGFVAAVTISAIAGRSFHWDGWPLAYALLWAPVGGLTGKLASGLITRFNGRLAPLFDLAAARADRGLLTRLFGLSLLLEAATGVIACWVPARIAVALWPAVSETPMIASNPDVNFGVPGMLALGAVGIARLFVQRTRLAFFAAPMVAAGIYLLLSTTAGVGQ